MPRLFAILCISFLLFHGSAFCQADHASEITEAMRNGNADGLGMYFNEMVDLNIPGFKDLYSKTQATRILRDFFGSRPVSELKTGREGTSADGSKYTTGTLTAGGKKYSMYLLQKKVKGEYRIFQLHFQPE